MEDLAMFLVRIQDCSRGSDAAPAIYPCRASSASVKCTWLGLGKHCLLDTPEMRSRGKLE